MRADGARVSPARRRRCGGRGVRFVWGKTFYLLIFCLRAQFAYTFVRTLCIHIWWPATAPSLPADRIFRVISYLRGGRGRPPVISSCSKDRAALPRNCLISDGYLFRCTSFAAPSRGRTAGANVALTASEHKGDCCPPPRASPSPSPSPLTMATATLGGNDQKVHVSFCCAFSCRIVVLVLIE